MSDLVQDGQITLALAILVQLVFVLFFVIAPVGGMLLARGMRRYSPAHIITIMVTVLVFNVVFVGVGMLLRNGLPRTDPGLDTVGMISLVVALVAAGLAAYVARLFLSGPPEYDISKISDHEDPLSFGEKRRQRIQKRRDR